MTTRTLVIAVFFLACAGSAGAQNLTLEFREGRVSIDATNVPVKTVLSEWARLGGTRVVGGERITSAPLTIHLESVPEAQALEVVLRNVAGYMAAPRSEASLGASLYDRILVLPSSSAPAAAASNRPGSNPQNAAGRNERGKFPTPQQNPEVVEDNSAPQNVVAPDAADTGVNEPPFQFPQQNPFQAGQAVQPGQAGPFGTPMPPGSQPPVIQFGPGAAQGGSQGVSVNPAPPQPTPMLQFPGMAPSGIGTAPAGAATPGVIIQPQQTQPGQPVRPPGGD
jgi:hypothetical protein